MFLIYVQTDQIFSLKEEYNIVHQGFVLIGIQMVFFSKKTLLQDCLM